MKDLKKGTQVIAYGGTNEEVRGRVHEILSATEYTVELQDRGGTTYYVTFNEKDLELAPTENMGDKFNSILLTNFNAFSAALTGSTVVINSEQPHLQQIVGKYHQLLSAATELAIAVHEYHSTDEALKNLDTIVKSHFNLTTTTFWFLE